MRGYLSVVWGCPYEGPFRWSGWWRSPAELLEMGVCQVSLGDTIGVGSPRQTEEILGQLLRGTRRRCWRLHFHDTRGLALANVLVSLSHGDHHRRRERRRTRVVALTLRARRGTSPPRTW